jgi:3-deoxy-D-manno-octulosonate 8-phosphate phosphatase (KDO 8-P phosphatase)
VSGAFPGPQKKNMPIREIKFPAKVMRRARKIRVFLMDVDGTLTRGVVCLVSFPDGSVGEMKVFDAHDGAGIKLASIMGIRTGLITGRDSTATTRRAREMAVEFVLQGQAKKLEAYKGILARAGVTDDEVAYLGDDLPDIPLLERAGLAVAVADAVPEVKRAAHYVTTVAGGCGAAREVVELILKSQGRWKSAIPKALA